MCGIAGIYTVKGSIRPDWIKNMTDILKHRGPDDEGFLAVNSRTGGVYHLTGSDSKVEGQKIEGFEKPVNLFLGHRRLSILDPTPYGHQPMSNEDKTIWITYNGEIYNYMELREELKSSGYQFKTNTDTEVLLAAYEEWGEECLGKLNGMWAFLIYDARKRMLFGSRDRFGVKPLYYYIDSDFFAFASEIKALVKIPFVKKEINPKAVFDYLVLGREENEEEGFFKNIFELQPSFAFHYDLSANTLKKWKYYTLSYTDKWEGFNEQKLVNYVSKGKELILNAVALRLHSDVPIGSCLSGGIDSSTIVCIINKLLEKETIKQIGEKQKVFTASYDMETIDESRWAKIVVEQTRTLWFRTFPKVNELLEDLNDLVYSQDIPFGSTSIYAQYRVMKLARENGVKVLLDGQGGDELFTGYTLYYRAFFIEMLKNFKIGELIREFKGLDNSSVNKKALFVSLMKLFSARILSNPFKSIALKATNKNNYLLNDDFWREHQYRLEMLKDSSITSLNQMLYEYISRLCLKTLLRYEDRNSMRFSIESRTPFADDINLIEYIFQIPSAYKIHNGWSKNLLRETMVHILPDKIRLRRDKIGFATPEYHWLNETKDELKNYITNDLSDFLNIKKMLGDWDRLMKNQPKEGITTIWRYINLAIWKNVYGL